MRCARVLLGGLLLVFSVACGQPEKRNPARAFVLDVAALGPQTCSDDRRVIVAVAMSGGRAGLNADDVRTLPEFRKRLHEVMGYRADKAVFVRAEPGVRWSEFIEMVGQVRPETDVVSLLTGSVAAQANYCGPILSCTDCRGLGGASPR